MIAFWFFGVESEIAKDERPIGKYISIACGAELTLTQLNWTQFIRFGDRETEHKNCEPDIYIYKCAILLYANGVQKLHIHTISILSLTVSR